MEKRETYAITIAGVERDLRLFEIKPGLSIAILNILGDVELVDACAAELNRLLKDTQYDVILTPETKSIPLAHMLSKLSGKPYIVLRKEYKPYMGEAISTETLSITTGKPQYLFLDEKDIDLITGKRVILLDDVISTGSTLQGMHLIIDKAGAITAREVGILTEGDRAEWRDILSLGHLPLFFG
ncbi:MAG: phosphoribosyltransferase family protein [Candidatus Omnitrophota bacterium]|jgi:adenine phosphoribosyltransferase|nr:phosphoribosyltransferase family protein [Anaerolineaceae bacterium]